MHGDYSRFTFDERKHYNGVLVQQGRVQLDADANEQTAINAHRDRTDAIDTIGRCGVPRADGGFRIVPLRPGEADLGITSGRIYVDGLLCETGGTPVPITDTPAANRIELATLDADGRPLEVGEWVELSSRTRPADFFRIDAIDADAGQLTLDADAGPYQPADGAVARRGVTYATQPDLPGAPALTPADGGRLLLYVDVWERHVTAVEDPGIREVALGGPDTTTRVQTVCQVRFHPAKVPDTAACGDPIDGFPPTGSGGRLTVGVTAPPPSDDPCSFTPEGGFRGLDNRLYRVEIHDPGDLGAATFKWSRDNGAVVFAVDKILDDGGSRLQLHRLGRDDVLTLHEDDWVEALDDDLELSDGKGVLARVSDVDQLGRTVTLTPPVPQLDPLRHPRLRRWDVPDTDENGTLSVKAEPVQLELGVQVQFGGADFRTGDFWTIPARTLTGEVGPLTSAAPQGIIHHHCRLALVSWSQSDDGLAADATDCRPGFPPLTVLEDHQQLVYVAGDGQEGTPGQPLPLDPTVAVRNAIAEPVRDVTVSFIPRGDSTVPSETVATDADGLAHTPWTLGPTAGLNQLQARLDPPQGGTQVIVFNARGGAQTGGLCTFTVGDGVRSQGRFTGPAGLQEAVNAAVKAGGATICVLPGNYALTTAIEVTNAIRLTIHGSRLESVITAQPGTRAAFRFTSCSDIEFSNLFVEGTGITPQVAPEGLVDFRGCTNLVVQRCRIVIKADKAAARCLLLDRCAGSVEVRDCELVTGGSDGPGGIALRDTRGARVSDNNIRVVAERGRFGIDLEGDSDECIVADNAIEAQPPDPNGLFAGSLGGVHVGTGCDDVVVRHNRIDGGSGLGVALGSMDGEGGSLGGLSDLTVEDNTIRRMAAGGVGVLGWRIRQGQQFRQPITDRLTLRRNRIEECSYGLAEAVVNIDQSGIVTSGTRLSGAVVLWMGEGIRLLDNDIIDNGVFDVAAPHPVPGVVVVLPLAGLAVVRNRIRNNGSPNLRDPDQFGVAPGGILVLSRLISSADEGSAARFVGNEVEAPKGPALALTVDGTGNVHVSGNLLDGREGEPNVTLTNRIGGFQFVDNHVVSSGGTTSEAPKIQIIGRHVLFASNRCEHLGPAGDHARMNCVAGGNASGNHVLERAVQNGRTSLRMTSSAVNTISAVGNVTTNALVVAPPGVAIANLTGVLV